MSIYFRDGRSVYFMNARRYEIEDDVLIVYGARNHQIAEVARDHIAFHFFDTEEVETAGYITTA